MICPRLFIQLGLKFTSDREEFHVEIYILISIMICVRVEKVGNHEIIDHLRPFSGMCLIMDLYFDWS